MGAFCDGSIPSFASPFSYSFSGRWQEQGQDHGQEITFSSFLLEIKDRKAKARRVRRRRRRLWERDKIVEHSPRHTLRRVAKTGEQAPNRSPLASPATDCWQSKTSYTFVTPDGNVGAELQRPTNYRAAATRSSMYFVSCYTPKASLNCSLAFICSLAVSRQGVAEVWEGSCKVTIGHRNPQQRQ